MKRWKRSGLDHFVCKKEHIERNKNITRSFHNVKALGVWFSTIKELLGKMTVIKSCLATQLVYVLSPLPTPNGYLQEINSLLYNFLWDDKGDKIKRTQMINDYTKGGLKMLDIVSFNNALNAKLVHRILKSKQKSSLRIFFCTQFP